MKRRILMVDDEEDLEYIVRQRFDKEVHEGLYDFVFARDGQSALDFFRPQDPYIDLMLTDIQMPGMSCLELLERVAHLSPGTVRVILSGFFDADYIRQAMHRGVSDVMQKPFHFKELDDMLEKLPPLFDPARKKIPLWPTGFRLMRVPHPSTLWSAELVTPEGFYVMVLPDVPSSTYAGAAGYHWAFVRNTLSCVARFVEDPLEVLKTTRRQVEMEGPPLPMAFCRLDNNQVFSLICEADAPFMTLDSLHKEAGKSLQFSIAFSPHNQEPHPLFIAEILKKTPHTMETEY